MKIPKQEMITERYIYDGVESYIVTRNPFNKYTLYKIQEGNYEKLKVAEMPVSFKEIIKKDRSK